MKATIVLLPGDGIGPEVTEQGHRALARIADVFGHAFTFESYPIGGAALDQTGEPLPASTLQAARAADAVLLGAVGGPKWDDPDAEKRPEDGLLGLRKHLDLFANLRPVRPFPALADASPLRPELLQDVDLLIVRELTAGLYFGEPRGRETKDGQTTAVDTLRYSEGEIRRLVELAFKLAAERRSRLTSVDKANVLESSRLWRAVVNQVAVDYPQVAVEHMLVDAAAMRLLREPASFDVLATENMFGDILSDEASMLAGSLGLLPSAALGAQHGGLYEPVHGSAPDLAGQNRANPVGALLSAAMLLRHGLTLETEARAIESAVARTLEEGIHTKDLGGSHSTEQIGDAVCARITRQPTPDPEAGAA